MTSPSPVKITVFKIFEDCLVKRSGGTLDRDPGFEAAMSNFMLCRIFRMCDFLVPVAERLDRYQAVLGKSDFYHLAYSLAPRRPRAPYVDYLKRKKKEEEPKTVADEADDGFAVI